MRKMKIYLIYKMIIKLFIDESGTEKSRRIGGHVLQAKAEITLRIIATR